MALNVDQNLVRFLSDAAAKPFVWGRDDCGLFIADWYVAKTGQADPASHLRGTYRSELECRRLYGDVAVAKQVRNLISGRGARVRDVEPGDVAILRVGSDAVGAIRGMSGWVVRGQRGLTRLLDGEVRIVAAWRFK